MHTRLSSLKVWLLWAAIASVLAVCIPGRAQDTLTYVAEEIVNSFDVRQYFTAGLEASDFTSPNIDASNQFPFLALYDNTTSITASNQLAGFATTGAIADPAVGPILSAASGGSLPADTYRIKYAWVGRFADEANGSTSGTTASLALTLLSPATDIVIGGGSNLINFTLPVDYPTGATGFAAYCERDGDAVTGYRLCSTVTNAPATTRTIGGGVFVANTLMTTNSTADMVNFGAYGQGWMRFGLPSGLAEPFLMRMSQTTGSTSLFNLGPTFDYSHDAGATVYALRDPRRSIPVCGTSRSLSTVVGSMDDTTLPIPTAASPVTLVQVGPCTDESVTWKSHLNFIGPGRGANEGNTTVTVTVTGVTDATFSGLDGIFMIEGSGASRLRFHDMHVGMTAGTRLTSSEDVVFDAVRTSNGVSTCSSIRFSGGSYTVKNSDFTCRGTTAIAALDAPTSAIEIGNETGSGVATPITYAVIAGNVMQRTPRTGTNYNGFLRGWYDATATPSTLLLAGNNIQLDNGDATACTSSAPGLGSLIAANTGLVDAGGGRVRIQSSGNVYWLRSCQKAIIWRQAQLDDDFAELYSSGDTMYAETTGTGSSIVTDEDTHCWEGAIGTGKVAFAGGSCINVNNANGGARPFHMHNGCCVSGENPQIFIDNYYIEGRSTANPATNGGWAVGNDCDQNSGCDIWVSNSTIRSVFTDSTNWADIFVRAAASAIGSTIVVRNVDYDTADTSGVYRVQRGMTAIGTAPSICTVGDTYSDTSGGYCICTAADTWTNISGVGNCT